MSALTRTDHHCPGLKLDGVLIEKMGERGLELIVGGRNDPDWGPIILVGFGGITAEILQDVRLITPDLPVDEIIVELNQLKSAALLSGFRGSPALDVSAVAKLIGGIGRFLIGAPYVRELDLNPVLVYPEGKGIAVLDALMITE